MGFKVEGLPSGFEAIVERGRFYGFGGSRFLHYLGAAGASNLEFLMILNSTKPSRKNLTGTPKPKTPKP